MSYNLMDYSLIKNKIISLINFGTDKTVLIRQDKQPQELIKEFDFSIGKKGKDQEEIISVIDQIINASVNTDHPFFMNQMYGKQNPISVYGCLLYTSDA